VGKKIPERYRLECADEALRSRPCWIQRVEGLEGVYVASQALKPDERGFPLVETLLIRIAVDGSVLEFESGKVVGQLGHGTGARSMSRIINWTDGSGAVWVEEQ
jgi:hypothetical protein